MARRKHMKVHKAHAGKKGRKHGGRRKHGRGKK